MNLSLDESTMSSNTTSVNASPIQTNSARQYAHSRRLRVFTEPKHSNKMHHTRTLSELFFQSGSPRVTPRNMRLEMDIEVSASFAQGEGMVDLEIFSRPENGMGSCMSTTRAGRESFFSNRSSICGSDEESAQRARSRHGHWHTRELSPEPIGLSTQERNDETQHVKTREEEEEKESKAEEQVGVSQVIDMLFEIHTALQSRQLGQRTAASALAASNLVSSVPFPNPDPIPRDDIEEMLDNTRKMLECAICQEVYNNATEATCCGQIFCKDCIERWVSERNSCPMCREDISYSLLVASRHIQRMANEMKVSCPYCFTNMRKALLTDHTSACDMAPAEPQDGVLRKLLLTTARLNRSNFQRFLMTPSPPQANMTQCYIRTCGGSVYELYAQDTDILLCTAYRRRQYDMSVAFCIYLPSSLEPQRRNSTSSNNDPSNLVQIARLEKNYMGSQYTIYSVNKDQQQSTEICAIQYAATFGKSPRQMRVALPMVEECQDDVTHGVPTWAMQAWQARSKDDTMLSQIDTPDPTRAMNLINKPPVWIDSLEAYCLDFGGRVAAASVKNFLLSHPDDIDKTLMLFGRTQDRQVYSMDYSHPFTPVQAFAVALSSMDSHLVTFD